MRATSRHRSLFALACLCGLALAALAGGTTSGAAGVEAACPNEALRQGASAVLSECRAYEMVSPPQKLGADVMADATRTRASVDGNSLGFVSLGAFADAIGTGITTEYIAERTPGGWQTHSITPLMKPQAGFEAIKTSEPRYVGELSDDLRTGVYRTHSPLNAEGPNVAGVKNLYLRRDLDQPGAGSYRLLSDAVSPVSEPPGGGPLFAGASADFSHVLFMSQLNLTADAPAQTCAVPGSASCETRTYEWADGTVRLVGQTPVAPAISCSGVDCVPVAESVAPGQVRAIGTYSTDTISRDGGRIFFKVGTLSDAEGALYVREDGTSTTQLNVSERSGPGFLQPGTQPAQFWAASADGSKVFFTTREQLTDESSGLDPSLYRADLDAPPGQRLQLVSVDDEPGDPLGGVGAIFGTSDNGSYVYFSANSQLVSGAQLRPAGDSLLYAWHDGELTFIAPLHPADPGENASFDFTLAQRPARRSPDGKSFLFVSRSSNMVTGSSLACGAGGLPCRRLYLFSAEANGGAGALACVSCRSGVPSSSDALAMPIVGNGGSGANSHLNHPLTDDGRLVFFSTGDRLVPADTNGRYDAYVYDTATGEAHLISSGRCNCDSYFLEATPDGSDAFFATRQQLVGWDVDGATDVYDARIEGGLPEPPAPPPSCQGDACQPPPLALPRPGLATTTSSGPGNPKRTRAKARKCPAGKRKVKARGNKTRCVARNRAHRNRRAGR